MPIRVIINADDFGINNRVNLIIKDLLEREIITSSTIMANSPHFRQAAEIASQFPMRSFGVHLNITDFKPLTSNTGLKPILDRNGYFNKKIFSTSLNSYLKSAIFYEWCAQIKKINSQRIKISHIDSHQHVHTIPHLFGVLKRTQVECGIKKIRITKNIYTSNIPPRSKLLIYKKWIWNFALKSIYLTKTTSGFTDFLSFYKYTKENRISHNTVELMVHPGADDKKFIEELNILKSCWVKQIPFDIELISYNEL
jgi:predicted glycoside hydrolase/deacetylase ChbG (UPF0249 family)